MRILGIDPGTARVGYGVIETDGDRFFCLDYGVISTRPKTPPAQRLAEICADLQKLLDEFQPAQAAVEKIFFQKNVKTAVAVAESRGAIMALLHQKNLEIIELSPQDAKLAVAGYGQADKTQVQSMVQAILKLDKIPAPDDSADALALAIAGAGVRLNLRV